MKHLFTSYYDDKGMYVIYNEETANADSVIEYVVVMLEQFINTLAEESDETIENVCILAKLSLSDEAKEKAKQDMQKMLDYVEKLDELDTDGVEPLSHIFGDENVFRDDVVTNGDDKEAMLFNAPKAKEGQYQVPKTIG